MGGIASWPGLLQMRPAHPNTTNTLNHIGAFASFVCPIAAIVLRAPGHIQRSQPPEPALCT